MKRIILSGLFFIYVSLTVSFYAQAFDGANDFKSTMGVSFHDGGKLGFNLSYSFGINRIISLGGTGGVVMDSRYAPFLENWNNFDISFMIRLNSAYIIYLSENLNFHADLNIGITRVGAGVGVTYMISENNGFDLMFHIPLTTKSFLSQIREKQIYSPGGYVAPYIGISFVKNTR